MSEPITRDGLLGGNLERGTAETIVRKNISIQSNIIEGILQETTMRKIILTLVGAALLATSTSDIALSKERHHFRNAQQRITERSRDTNAYAAPYYVPNTRPSYSGLDGAWGAMTGFD